MVKCIWCGEEIEGTIREHMAEKHIGVKQPEPMKPDPPPPTAEGISHGISHGIANEIPKTNTPTLPLEKPKKRYLNADEIITLLQNTNKRFMSNELAGCPLTKETE
jgi:hypothetical protein